MFNKKGENMELKNDYKIGLSPDFEIAFLKVLTGTEDIDAVSMDIKAHDLEQAKEIYRLEFAKDFDFILHHCEVTGRII